MPKMVSKICQYFIAFSMKYGGGTRGEQYAHEVGALFCETSALESTNVEEFFVRICELFTWFLVLGPQTHCEV